MITMTLLGRDSNLVNLRSLSNRVNRCYWLIRSFSVSLTVLGGVV